MLPVGSVLDVGDLPGALGVGHYHASPVESSDRSFTSDPLTKQERAALTRFAERSATRHGCGAPTAPAS